MKIAVAYCRMSTDKQEDSIESQLRMIKLYAENNNYKIIEIYCDEGISGRSAQKRPAFMKMIADSEKKSFNYILIFDSSRFARNLEESLVFKSKLKTNNVSIISITEPNLDEDTSLLTDALYGAINEMYSIKLAQHVIRGMEQKVLNGEYLSMPPLGYKKVNKKLVIEKSEATIIKFIFEEFCTTQKSIFEITKNLNLLGYKTKRGNLFTVRAVKSILQNETYIGKTNWNGIKKDGLHKPIVSSELFRQANEKYNNTIKKTHKSRPKETYKHWLIGLLRCNECKSTYVYKKGYNGRKSRLGCGGYANGKCNSTHTIKIETAEKIVLQKLNFLFQNSLYKYQLKNVNQKNINNIVLLDKALKKYTTCLQKAKTAYFNGIDTINEYEQNKTYFQKKITEVQTQLSFEKKIKIKTPTPYVKNICDILISNEFSISDKHSLLKTIIEKIIISNQNTIEFHFFI